MTARHIKRLVVITVGIFVVSTGGLFTWIEAHTAGEIMRDAMMAEALMLKASFDIDKISELSGTPADLNSFSYHYLRNQLIRIRDTNPKYRYLYFFGRHNGQPPFFFMGTAPEGSADYSPPGQVYFEDSPTLNYVFATRSPSISPPFKDRWGTWISALVPVIDPQNGNLIAIFGMDIDASDWKSQIIRRAMMPVIITCLTILIMGFGTEYLRRRQLIDHIVLLKRAEETLRESEERYKSIIAVSNTGAWEYHHSADHLWCSNEYVTMLGYNPEEFINKKKTNLEETWISYLHPDDRKSTADKFADYLKNGSRGMYENYFRMRHKDGNWLWIWSRGQTLRNKDGSLSDVTVGTHIDITNQKKAEAALKKSENDLRITLNSIGDAVIATDKQGLITAMNPVAEKLTGWEVNKAKGRELSQVFNIINSLTRKIVVNPVEIVLKQKKTVGLANHTLLVSKNGIEYQIADSGAPIRSETGEISGVVLVFRDVTEEYALRDKLFQGQKMEAIGTLAGGIAHDFNNILSGIFGFSQLAKRHLKEPEKAGKDIDQIVKGAQKATELVQQILTLSRKSIHQKKPVPVYLIIKEALKLLRATIPATIEIKENIVSQSTVMADPAKIHQIIMNLCTNAYHAMHTTGGNLFVGLKENEF